MIKKLYKYCLLVLAVISSICIVLSQSCTSRQSEIRIGIIGDQFGAYDTEQAYTVMEQAAEKLKQHQPDMVLHVGDMVESIRNVDDFEDYQTLFQRAAGIMGSIGVPWMVALGDHDVNPPGYKPLSDDLSRQQWFLQLAQNTSLPVDSLPYYSYNYKNYHFISLYSLENLHTDPRWGSIFLNKISERQISWLEQDLRRHRHTQGTIVIVHHPHWYVWSNWYPVHQILAEYNVRAVIAGHLHYDQDGGIIDGIRYFVMGSTGGAIKDADPHSGGAQEYALMEIKRRKQVQIQLYSAETDEPLEITPRRSMDRLQALACMLDNLWQDENLYWQGDQLYSQDHNQTELVQAIDLESLGNPIDLPIQILIDTPSDVISSSQWIVSNSIIIRIEQGIEVSPGNRIDWANYANVGQWSTRDELWQGKVNSEALRETQQIPLIITVRFSDSRERYIRRTISYQVK